MAVSSAAMAEHLAAFVRIANASHTKELHAWTSESLERAFAWAKVIEKLSEKAIKDGPEATRDLEATLASLLQTASLPSPRAHEDGISVDVLRNATRHVCDAVLTSPWLYSHPRRAELTTLVFKKLVGTDENTAGNSLSSHRDLFVKQLRARHTRESMGQISEVMARGFKRTRVQVHSTSFDIPSRASYNLEQRTLRLRSLAKTLQANVRVANSLAGSQQSDGQATLREFLSRVETQLRQADKDVVETVVWSVVLDWPPELVSVRTAMIKTIEAWLSSQQPAQLFILEPWLAAMFASHSEAYAHEYLGVMLTSCLRLLDQADIRARIGALVLQGGDLQAAVEDGIGRLDLVTREQLLSYIVE